MPTELTDVSRLRDFDLAAIASLLATYGLQLECCADNQPIPGSFWGDEEAGLRLNRLYARADTPLHSILHETCHFVCLDPTRRSALDTDAGSDDTEENAVCYLQILLANEIDGYGRERMLTDMDTWGYSFRLGSSKAWFDQDADDARAWLLAHDLIDAENRPRFRLRQGF